MPQEELSKEDIDRLLARVDEKAAAGAEAEPAAAKFEMPEMSSPADAGPSGMPASERTFDILMDVNLNVRIELGKARMLVEDVLKLKQGSLVPLDKLAGDPVDILVNDRLVARGDVMVINDVFCVRVTEILNPKQRLMALR